MPYLHRLQMVKQIIKKRRLFKRRFSLVLHGITHHTFFA
jgi:hypothetical protein